LIDTAGSVFLGLSGLELALEQLLIEHRDLLLGGADVGFSLIDSGLSLDFAGVDLLVIENGDDVAGVYQISFAVVNFEDATGGFTGDGGVVTFDAAAERDDAVRYTGIAEVAPKQKRGDDEDRERNDANDFLALGARGVFGAVL